MSKGQHQLLVGALIIVAVGVSLGGLYYYTSSIEPTQQSDQTTTTTTTLQLVKKNYRCVDSNSYIYEVWRNGILDYMQTENCPSNKQCKNGTCIEITTTTTTTTRTTTTTATTKTTTTTQAQTTTTSTTTTTTATTTTTRPPCVNPLTDCPDTPPVQCVDGYWSCLLGECVYRCPASSTTTTTTTTTTTILMLSADNLIDCINFRNGVLYYSPSCPYCLQQKAIFNEAAPPAGPATKWSSLDIRGSTGSPCGGVPCWVYGTKKVSDCKSLPGLNSFYNCNLRLFVGYTYDTC